MLGLLWTNKDCWKSITNETILFAVGVIVVCNTLLILSKKKKRMSKKAVSNKLKKNDDVIYTSLKTRLAGGGL